MTALDLDPRASRLTYTSLFLVALATLMYEVLLTRIFSVTLYYHFAFVAVSVALFGMTLGAVLVYLLPSLFTPNKARRAMAKSALLFGVTIVITFVIHLKSENKAIEHPQEASPFALWSTYALITVPFIFSGIAVCIALTRFPRQVSRLYAADLAGAALGCILFVIILRLTDGPTAVLLVATLATLAAVCSALEAGCKRLIAITALIFLAASALTSLNAYRGHTLAEKRLENVPRASDLAVRSRWVSAPPPIRIENAKGSSERPALFDAWNAFSRIRVVKAGETVWLQQGEPSGWGMSPVYLEDPAVPKITRELFINIDSGAGTYITQFGPAEALHLIEQAEDHDSQAIFYDDEAYNARVAKDADKERDNIQLAKEERDESARLRNGAVRSACEVARQQVGFLKYDVTNFAHLLRPDSNVLVIGSGGGRDLLAALVFNQRHVTGVEINDSIIRAMKVTFGDFAGHLDRLPNVDIFHDEARSYITRMPNKVDVIQISLIDTWAATAAGAFVLSENSLYTVEAWKAFLTHLTDRGVVTVSRWYHPKTPGETLRMVSLANQALREVGVTDPRRHIMVVKRHQQQLSTDLPPDVATILASRTPFTDADITLAQAQAKQMGFELLLTPQSNGTKTDYPNEQVLAAVKGLEKFASSPDPYATAAEFQINLAPPTDDKPFFFNMTRMRDAFNPAKWQGQGHDVNLKAVQVVAGLLVFVVLLTGLCVVLPVFLKADRAALRGSLPLTAFFIFIGLGFILVEISQMQRLIILLGHPTYSLSVVLFALLVSSGIGSYLTRSVDDAANLAPAIARRMIALLILLVIIGLITPVMIRTYVSSATSLRVSIALLLLMPAGLFMGMCFPLGMKAAANRQGDITAWLWGINGAMSVVASVLSVVIAMSFGIAVSWWTGVACYALALATIHRATRNKHAQPSR